MSELLAPPDIEPAVVACLSFDTDVWVATRFVDNAGGTIRVSSTGGGPPSGRVAVALTVLVECWHEDEGRAADIARRAWARLVDAAGTSPGGVEFKHVEAMGINNNADPNRLEMSRFQFLATIHTRIVPLEAS